MRPVQKKELITIHHCSGMTLIETIIASSIFIVFVGAALSASTAASSQERLNSASSDLMEACGRLKVVLSDELSRVGKFQAYDYDTKTGVGAPIYPSANVIYSTSDTNAHTYQFDYIKLRSHAAIDDNPANLGTSHKTINNTSAFIGTDGTTMSLANYSNALFTPYMIYDATASGSQWWMRPIWETDRTHGLEDGGQDLAANSDPINLRIYSIILAPENGATWVNYPDKAVSTVVELGTLTLAYTNPEQTTPTTLKTLATGVERQSFSITTGATDIVLTCKMHRSLSHLANSSSINRLVQIRVPFAKIP